jgi:surface antigen
MKTKLLAPVIAIAIAALAGCASAPSSGRASGASAGAAGSVSIVMTPEVNHALDTAIRNQPVTWSDAESGTQTEFTVLRMYQKDDGTYCREFTESVSKGGGTDSAQGVACRQPDGTWRAASN